MPDNKLELVVEVDVNKANASIKSINTGLSSMEQAASKAAKDASSSIDGMTATRAWSRVPPLGIFWPTQSGTPISLTAPPDQEPARAQLPK